MTEKQVQEEMLEMKATRWLSEVRKIEDKSDLAVVMLIRFGKGVNQLAVDAYNEYKDLITIPENKDE